MTMGDLSGSPLRRDFHFCRGWGEVLRRRDGGRFDVGSAGILRGGRRPSAQNSDLANMVPELGPERKDRVQVTTSLEVYFMHFAGHGVTDFAYEDEDRREVLELQIDIDGRSRRSLLGAVHDVLHPRLPDRPTLPQSGCGRPR